MYQREKSKQSFELLPGAFAENILTDTISLHTLSVGTRLKIGTELCEVTQIRKECHADWSGAHSAALCHPCLTVRLFQYIVAICIIILSFGQVIAHTIVGTYAYKRYHKTGKKSSTVMVTSLHSLTMFLPAGST